MKLKVQQFSEWINENEDSFEEFKKSKKSSKYAVYTIEFPDGFVDALEDADTREMDYYGLIEVEDEGENSLKFKFDDKVSMLKVKEALGKLLSANKEILGDFSINDFVITPNNVVKNITSENISESTEYMFSGITSTTSKNNVPYLDIIVKDSEGKEAYPLRVHPDMMKYNITLVKQIIDLLKEKSIKL